ncbi:multidrug efflux RND transporter permease subunit [Motilimonas cestriensis]|uniref:Multidrug efflux RND transporter permease subunit n=1 Tax=Motilimonas cestriensis TaxID=2742685 RepID=A0ABS8WBM4_9GAMM|nr:multidrug efflux RND transporter permease subunit [Motilimonas cestriensis]MCE2596416.1 multidrug efflux RND transporter permease subunit [Motilimonas cestriensis]
MLLSDVAIKRPVFGIVLSLLLVIFGLVSFSKMSVREMPEVENPVVTINTSYTGASASIMESQVTKTLEDQLSGISGIDNITSVSRNGMSRITINFLLDWNITEGVSDIRDAVARAQGRLPDEADDPVVSKDNGSGEPSIYINLESSEMDRTQLTDYAERVLADRFSFISGVSDIGISGALYKVMYVQLDPVLMAGRGVTSSDVLNALKKENMETPGGEVRNDVTTMPVRTSRLYLGPEDFEYLAVKQNPNAPPTYLKDIAKVWVGAQNESSTFKSNGVQNLSLGIIPQSDANPLTVAKKVRAEVDKLQSVLPAGTQLYVDYDATLFIERSIQEVYNTLMITGGLVILVLYLFIGQVRATLIPAITVPVSLISAFIVAYFFGFSINLLTLMALILAIGLVVDDTIVVVENILHHLEQGESPLVAAFKGCREVGFAVVATTLVLVMVFIPIAFMEGMIGRLFTEFAVLLAIAVSFSSFVALTLSPVLASKLFKGELKKGPIALKMDAGFSRIEQGYRRLLSKVVIYPWLSPAVILACLLGCYYLVQEVPNQLAPQEDRGVIFAFVKGAEGTSYNRMIKNVEQVERQLLPLIGQGTIRSMSVQAPAFGGRAGDNTAFVIMQLEDWEQRDVSASDSLKLVKDALVGIPDVRVWPMLPGFRGGSSDPVQFVLRGSDYKELFEYASQLKERVQQSGLFTGPDLDYAETTPELVVHIDRARAAQLGVSVQEIADTLEVMLGGQSETTFIERGEEYDVYLRGDENRFNNASDLSQIYLRTQTGELITLDTVTDIEEVASARRLSHLQKQKSITLSANLADGVTLGEGLAYLEQQAQTILPPDISMDYSGESKDFKDNQSDILIVFALALLVAYLVLAAQFESFINPLVVMFTVPMGIVGGLLGLWLTQGSLNIYSQIGMIMLIGMVTKNGILIVEFANQLRDKGIAFEEAVLAAASRRLRPILMTAFTTLIGAIPLIMSTGAGAESRIAVGTVIFSGMALATLVTLFVIPSMYQLMARHTHSPEHVSRLLAQQLAEK